MMQSLFAPAANKNRFIARFELRNVGTGLRTVRPKTAVSVGISADCLEAGPC